MTAQELRNEFSKKFGFQQWPPDYVVDAETYANVCQAVFDSALEHQFPDTSVEHFYLRISTGPNNGIMFKGVELILEGRVINGREAHKTVG